MLSFNNEISFAHGEIAAVSLRNFWEPEDGFVWSTGPWCEVIFSFEDTKKPSIYPVDLVLDLDVFKEAPRLQGQNVYIYMNGLRISSNFLTRRIISLAPFDPKVLRPSDNVITIDTPNSTRPTDLGIPDDRVLGIQLFSVQIRKGG